MKRENRIPALCMVALVLFSAIGSALAPRIDPSVTASAAGGDPVIKLKKVRSVEVVYLSDGSMSSEKIDVSLQLTNSGDRDVIVGLVDRAKGLTSDLVMLGGTPSPSLVERIGEVTYIAWEEVLVPAKSALAYEYEAETDESLPITFQEKIYVNGERRELIMREGSRMVGANLSDIVTWSLVLTMKSPRIFTGPEYAVNPVLLSVSVSLNEEAFTDISPNPRVNSTLSLGGAKRINWILVLMDSQSTLNVSARVASRGAWGVVSIDPINVQIIEDPELMIGQMDSGVKMLSANILAYRETEGAFTGLGLAVQQISQGILETESSLQSSSEGTAELQQSLEDLQTQIQDLLNQSSGEAGGLDQIIEALNQSTAQVDELAAAINASKAIHQIVINSLGLMSDSLPEMIAALNLLIQSMETVDEAMEGLLESMPEIRQLLYSSIQALEGSIDILESVRDQITDPVLKAQLQLVIDQLTVVVDGLKLAYESFDETEEYVREMAQAIDLALAASRGMASGVREMQKGLEAMMEALSSSVAILDGILAGLPAAKEANEELADALNQTVEAQMEAQEELRLLFERMGATFEGISSALEMGQKISGGLREVAGSLSNITEASAALGVQAAENVTNLEDQLVKLQESKRAMEHFSRVVEFGGAEVRVPGAGCSFAVAPAISHDRDRLTVEKVYVDPVPTVAYNATAFVYWVWISLCNGAHLRSIEAFVNGTWVAVQNTTALRISYIETEGSILVPVYKEIPITKRSNILLDLAGHPLRITLSCGSQPKVHVSADIAFYPPEVIPQGGEAASQLVLNQPQILLAHVAPSVTVTTTSEVATPVPITAVSILLVITLAAIVLVLTSSRRGRKETGARPAIPEELTPTAEIVQRIEELEKKLDATEDQ